MLFLSHCALCAHLPHAGPGLDLLLPLLFLRLHRNGPVGNKAISGSVAKNQVGTFKNESSCSLESWASLQSVP